MASEIFVQRRFSAKSRKVIEQANEIITEYQAQGFTLTLRQLFYQFVSRGLLENSRVGYRLVCNVMSAARDAGEIDWDAIEDRMRVLQEHTSYTSPAESIRTMAAWYQEELWRDQPYHVEVWIEKDALVGVIEDICNEYRVSYLAHRGSNSISAMHEAGTRLAGIIAEGRTPIVLHLTDHDPTGIDMTRDTVERLAKYARQDIEVRRLALTIEQVRRYTPPPNLTKEGDTRTVAYRRMFGTDECWELDALSPDVIVALIHTELEGLIDRELWDAAMKRERGNRKLLVRAATNWAEVQKLLRRR